MTTHKTRGIVLRAIKYGETSLVATIYTELFGIQSYLVNGVRTTQKKGPGKANLFQPAAILDLVVYHNELKNLQRIREFKWGILYKSLFFDVLKNSVALFMVELLLKTIRQPETSTDLYLFLEDAFIHLDEASTAQVGNYPLYFALHLAGFLGLRLSDGYSEKRAVLDLQEGEFTSEHPVHPYFLEKPYSHLISQVLKALHPSGLEEIRMNQETRRKLLQACETFYALHIQEFGNMKTLQVLQEVLS